METLAVDSPLPYFPEFMPIKPCRVCLTDHDPEIHESTLAVRSWFREQVKLGWASPQANRENRGVQAAVNMHLVEQRIAVINPWGRTT